MLMLVTNLLVIFVVITLLFSIVFPLKMNNIQLEKNINVEFQSLKLSIAPYTNDEKLTVYESGSKHFENPNKLSFYSQFYLLGILFLVFDVEVLIIYPLLSSIYIFSSIPYIFIIFFILSVFLGFLYELYCGSLDF